MGAYARTEAWTRENGKRSLTRRLGVMNITLRHSSELMPTSTTSIAEKFRSYKEWCGFCI